MEIRMGRPPVLQGNSTYNSKVSSRGGATAAITSSRSSGSISSFKRVACIGVRIHVYINTYAYYSIIFCTWLLPGSIGIPVDQPLVCEQYGGSNAHTYTQTEERQRERERERKRERESEEKQESTGTRPGNIYSLSMLSNGQQQAVRARNEGPKPQRQREYNKERTCLDGQPDVLPCR